MALVDVDIQGTQLVVTARGLNRWWGLRPADRPSARLSDGATARDLNT